MHTSALEDGGRKAGSFPPAIHNSVTPLMKFIAGIIVVLGRSAANGW